VRICLLGDCSGRVDEGMKQIAYRLRQELARRHHVISLDPRSVFHRGFWASIREFAPDVIHYIPGPSTKSFVVMRTISLALPSAKTIMSAPLPLVSALTAGFVRFMKPDLVLAQSKKMESIFRQWGLVTEYLPVSGVDVNRFKPASGPIKEALRRKYSIEPNQFVVLHVGHVKAKRNIQLLKRLQRDGVQTVVVGSTSTGIEVALRDDLAGTGCRVITEYVEKIDEIYRQSDCYVFPTPKTNRSACIEVPLSVLEAASCNLPIVSTRFGALPEIFDGVDGFIFAESEERIVHAVQELRSGSLTIKTRESALPFSWEHVTKKVEEVYEKVCS
jgi:glycosyltransferase involved in cell wall biosynthesis